MATRYPHPVPLRGRRARKHHGYSPRKQQHWRREWGFKIHGIEGVQAVLCMLWPWLSREKKDQALAVLRTIREENQNRTEPKLIGWRRRQAQPSLPIGGRAS